LLEERMHVTTHLLEAVDRGEAAGELLDEIEREHLSALCGVCSQALLAHETRLRRPGSIGREEPRDPVERLRGRMSLREVELRVHEENARSWVRDLVKLDPRVRRAKVAKAYVRFKGPLFCMLVLEEARRRIPGEPAEAFSLADAALASNEKTAVYLPDSEVQAPALAVRGNARRALGRLVEAEVDLEEARRPPTTFTWRPPSTGSCATVRGRRGCS
jgi:hypothetical protein